MTILGKQILALRAQGCIYRDIQAQLGCSRSTVSYYCGYDQKVKTISRISLKRREKKRYFVRFFGGKCVRCGYNRSIDALDFHHRNKSLKESNPSVIMRKAKAKAIKELKKCDLVCANCHREIHSPDLIT